MDIDAPVSFFPSIPLLFFCYTFPWHWSSHSPCRLHPFLDLIPAPPVAVNDWSLVLKPNFTTSAPASSLTFPPVSPIHTHPHTSGFHPQHFWSQYGPVVRLTVSCRLLHFEWLALVCTINTPVHYCRKLDFSHTVLRFIWISCSALT